MQQNTHMKIDSSLCGEVVEIGEGRARVSLLTTAQMSADEEGLVHGGFIFGAADFAAMCAVNEPNVVLAGSECRFLAPSVVGDTIDFEATVVKREGAKALVEVQAVSKGKSLFNGNFKTVVTKEHVLKKQQG
ncbi:PaaI family thioesterase [Sulfurimonas sp. HSL3-7]|uniref:PaaI family thioesterase n=1 Tax=Sulfonitrofixus jiaomeiensis TaxID=3131938 RepID=UPI0031F98DF0